MTEIDFSVQPDEMQEAQVTVSVSEFRVGCISSQRVTAEVNVLPLPMIFTREHFNLVKQRVEMLGARGDVGLCVSSRSFLEPSAVEGSPLGLLIKKVNALTERLYRSAELHGLVSQKNVASFLGGLNTRSALTVHMVGDLGAVEEGHSTEALGLEDTILSSFLADPEKSNAEYLRFLSRGLQPQTITNAMITVVRAYITEVVNAITQAHDQYPYTNVLVLGHSFWSGAIAQRLTKDSRYVDLGGVPVRHGALRLPLSAF